MVGFEASGNWQHTTVEINTDSEGRDWMMMVGSEGVLFFPSTQVQNERVATRGRGFHASEALKRS